VKLAILATVTLLGCAAENDGEGGAAMEGLEPAKLAPDNPNGLLANNVDPGPGIDHVLEARAPVVGQDDLSTIDDNVTIERLTVPFPIEGLCTACDVDVLRDLRNPGTLRVLDDRGQIFCRIWVGETGRLLSTDCR